MKAMDDYLVGKTMDEPQNFAEGGDVVAEDTVTIGQDFTPSKNMAEAQAKLDTGVKDLRADRKAQFDKMTEQLTSGAVKDMELEEQENFVALYKLLKQHHSFAEGGAVPMKEQMSMFEDGGLMDEGGTIDPVSGNDVPPGSTQEEVRDDIPAQLSEGEFVFPADVVRFIGLSNLMQIRQEAKMGLKQMDAMGQMGNSDEATMPDDLPFDLNDLDMEDDGEYNDTQEFAVGGMPTPNTNTGVYYTPAAAQGTTGVTAPQPVQAASSQYVAPQQQAVPTTATTATPTYESFIKPVEGSAPEIREYINTKTGEKMSITFVNNQPTVAIPPDFVPASEYVAPETVASQTSRVKSTKQVDEPAGREEIEKEEAMFGSGGGRISLGGNVDKGRVSGSTQFGVSFSGLGGLPGVGGMAMTGLSLATGKPIPDSARATITRDGVSVTVTGREYNAMKENNFRGPEAARVMNRWSDEKDFSDKMDTVSNAQRDVKAAQKAADKAKTPEEKTRAEQARQDAGDKAVKAVQDAYFAQEQRAQGDVSKAAPDRSAFDYGDTGSDNNSSSSGSYDSSQDTSSEGAYEDDDMYSKGGSVTKQMKRSGLASK